MNETICRNCAHLHSEAKSAKWFSWLCLAYPIEPTMNYVTGENNEPYARCRDVNRTGNCSDFLVGYNTFNPKESADGI